MESFITFSVFALWFLLLFNSFLMILLFRQFGEVYLSSGEGISRDGLQAGEKLPEYKCYSLIREQETSLPETITKPALLAFVSPDCKPCLELLDDWRNAQLSFKNDIDFILIWQGDKKKVLSLMKEKQLAGEVLWDKTEEISYLFKIRVTPFAFAVDKEGRVVDKGLCGSKKQIDIFLNSLENHQKQTEGVQGKNDWNT